jgi:hypothetical protein
MKRIILGLTLGFIFVDNALLHKVTDFPRQAGIALVCHK